MRHLNVLKFLVIVLPCIISCGGKSKSSGGDSPTGAVSQNPGEQPAVGAVAWLFQGFPYPFVAEHGEDAVTYVHGRMLLKSIPTIDGLALSEESKKLPAAIVSNRYLLFKPLAANAGIEAGLSDVDRAFVAEYCSDIDVSLAGGLTDGTLDSEVFEVRWRSHFPAGYAEKLALLLLAANSDFRCGLEFGLNYYGAAETSLMALTFSPAPEFDPVKIQPGNVYAGTDRFNVARDEALLLPEVRSQKLEALDAGWEKTLLTSAPEKKAAVPAINASDFQLGEPEGVAGENCELRLTDTLKVMNPEDTQTISYKTPVHSQRSAILDAVGPGAAETGICKELVFKKAPDGGFGVSVSCLQVKQIVDAGKCGLKLQFSNTDEPTNTVEVIAVLGGLKYGQLDLGKPQNAVTLLPQAAQNPVRDGIITMTMFSNGQKQEMAKSFDLWQAVSAVSYDSFFKTKINEIEFDNGGPNCAGAGAYAYLNSDKVYWCPGGGMTTEALSATNSPSYLVYRATTALHESLHANGNPHDIDVPGNLPCSSDAGTAFSAIVPVATYNCSEDYCYGYRELAREEFMLELNYSLKNDARRFQGQCDIWAKQLGVAF